VVQRALEFGDAGVTAAMQSVCPELLVKVTVPVALAGSCVADKMTPSDVLYTCVAGIAAPTIPADEAGVLTVASVIDVVVVVAAYVPFPA
jgi:hypothetical protein